MSKRSDQDKDAHNNTSNQRNPNHDAYWQSRGYEERPQDWADRLE